MLKLKLLSLIAVLITPLISVAEDNFISDRGLMHGPSGVVTSMDVGRRLVGINGYQYKIDLNAELATFKKEKARLLDFKTGMSVEYCVKREKKSTSLSCLKETARKSIE